MDEVDLRPLIAEVFEVAVPPHLKQQAQETSIPYRLEVELRGSLVGREREEVRQLIAHRLAQEIAALEHPQPLEEALRWDGRLPEEVYEAAMDSLSIREPYRTALVKFTAKLDEDGRTWREWVTREVGKQYYANEATWRGRALDGLMRRQILQALREVGRVTHASLLDPPFNTLLAPNSQGPIYPGMDSVTPALRDILLATGMKPVQLKPYDVDAALAEFMKRGRARISPCDDT